jgi:DNA polymerase
VYAENSECILFIYALDQGDVNVWQPLTQPIPQALHEYLSNPRVELAAHNVDFDRTQMLMWRWCQGYDLSPSRFFCTMTAARMAGLPGSLDDLCQALGLPDTYAKKDGRALIQLFCVPNKKTGEYTHPMAYPERWQSFMVYGMHDVLAMREAMRLTPQVFNDTERALYSWTSVMNDRGICIDQELVTKGRDLAAKVKAGLKRNAQQLTGTESFNVTSQKALMEFLRSYGASIPDARAATLETFLETEQSALLPPVVAQVLRTRLTVNKASVAKLPAIIRGTNYDGRVRGTIVFGGAQRTGRDAGRRIQPQNLAKPVLLGDDLSMEEACAMVKDGSAEYAVSDPLQLISDTIRGALIAPPGHKLCQADLSNIEGRACPWLAGEESKLQYFRDFDAGAIKYDNYVMAYAKSFNIPPSEVNKAGRQIGKVQELASQFGGGVGAYVAFATMFRLDIDAMGRGIAQNADPHLVEDCRKSYNWFQEKGLTYGLPVEVWAGIQAGVKAWRASHPMIERSWKKADAAFRNAINHPNVAFEMATNTYVTNNGWGNFVQLPSGRFLVYPQAHETDKDTRRPGLGFAGVHPYSHKWTFIYTTGPRLIENLTQAVARDVLMWHVPTAEQHGYKIVTRVHDELLTETPDTSDYSGDTLARIIGRPHHWCATMPVAAVGEEYKRYQK